MTAKKKYYYLFTSILFFNILGVLFDTFFSLVLVSGMKEGNSIINISREDETYGGSILVRVEEPEKWYENWKLL